MKHLFIGRASGNLRHWESGVGWTDFTPTPTGERLRTVHGAAPNDIWVGGKRYLEHWTGSAWTTYDLGVRNYLMVHTAGGDAVFVGGRTSNVSLVGHLWKFNGSTFNVVTSPASGGEGQLISPWTISQDECYYTVGTSYIGGTDLFRYTTAGGAAQHSTGKGLPTNKKFGGLVKFGDELFVLDEDGNVWRGTWEVAWVLDNATDGPFAGFPASIVTKMLEVAADGSTVCAKLEGSTFWIRNGVDSWVATPTNPGGQRGEPAMVDSQYLLVGDLNTGAWSDDGGITWANPAPVPGNDQTEGTLALDVDEDPPVITPISPIDGVVGVAKDTSVIFTVTDDISVALSTVQAWIKGGLVFANGKAIGWLATVEAITDGYRITLDHATRETYFEDGEQVDVRVYAEDISSNSDTERWSFNVTRRLGLRIYPMLFEGVRKIDQE